MRTRPNLATTSNAQLAATVESATRTRRAIRREIAALQVEIAALQRRDRNIERQEWYSAFLLDWRRRAGATSRDIYVEYDQIKKEIYDTPAEDRPVLTGFSGSWAEQPKRKRGRPKQQAPAETPLATWDVTLTWPTGRVGVFSFTGVEYVSEQRSPIGGQVIIIHTEGGYSFRVRNPGDWTSGYFDVAVCGSILDIIYSKGAASDEQ